MCKIIVFEGIDGAGKTTLINALQEELKNCRKKTLVERLAPIMVRKFKEIVDDKTGIQGHYQDIIDQEFRLYAYIIESILQFEYKKDIYKQYDYIFFDRWMYTNYAYLGELVWNKKWGNELIQKIPTPDLTIWLQISASNALERLKNKGDWMVKRYESRMLQDKLEVLAKRYENIFSSKVIFSFDAMKNIDLLVKEVLEIVDTIL